MNPLIQLKQKTSVFLLAFGITWFGLLATVRAVSPAPDGGYPGQNTAEGSSALLHLNGGTYNTAVGWSALDFNVIGNLNTAVGAGSLLFNTADQNTATGAGALLHNTTGPYNTANGAFALESNTQGDDNAAIGAFALQDNTTGSANTAIGSSALLFNTTGSNNSAIGLDALGDNTSGNNNTAIGDSAGANLTTGNNNIDIGYNVVGVAAEANTIRIGNTDITTTIIRGISGQTIPSGATVIVASNGQLGTMTSSERFKQGIKPMDKASEAILALKPVTFRYKKEIDPAGTSQFGLVAEEVEKVNSDLVLRDEAGKPYTVRYEQINAMLLNEFLKEHKKVERQVREIQEQRATISELRKEMGAVIAHLKEQDLEIQKVSARVEINKAGPKVVTNDP